jgi:DNA-binding Lrp family transcriptional regulator
MAAPDAWTPIVVARDDLTIIDGSHRLVAAERLGRSEIAGEMFDGCQEKAFLEFVRRNLEHGTGMTRGERKDAARRILCSHPHWADRRISEFCGVSQKTVAHLRRQLTSVIADKRGGNEVRVGRDGRVRPVDPAAQRARIIRALEERPDASLRAIARIVGASPETVRSVRARLGQSGILAEETPRSVEVAAARRPRSARRATKWQPDVALTSRKDGEITAEFLVTTDVNEADLEQITMSIPLSRVYEVADEARRRAMFWSNLAKHVEARAQRGGC